MKLQLRITVETLLRQGQRAMQRLTGVDRKTIRRLSQQIAEPIATEAPESPEVATGSCGRAQVELGRNAQSIYQDLVGGVRVHTPV